MMSSKTVCIIGGGIAGNSVAHGLLTAAPDTRVVVIDDDPDGPYDRPPLTKRLMDDGFVAEARPGWATDGVEWVEAHAVSIDPSAPSVTLDTGEVVIADDVVLATGGRPRTQSRDMWGFACIRTAADARWLRDRIQSSASASVLIEGAGPLGCEIATALRRHGARVVIVEADRLPMRRLLGPDIGAAVADWAGEHDVDLRLTTHIVDADRLPTGSFNVKLSDGDSLTVDVAVSTIGMIPASELVAGWAAADNRGVRCDEEGRVLNEKGAPFDHVWAVGDVAAVEDSGSGVVRHLESWTNASEHGAAVAAHILGSEPPVTGRPYFWTEAFGRRVQVLGHVPMNPSPAEQLADYPERHGAVFRFDQEGSPAAWVAINAPRDFAVILKEEKAPKAMT
jgi:3-phenylpropionate/trans-cinnamate dioxygenase ferredoxin reductase subunit